MRARLESKREGILVFPFFGYSLLLVMVVPPLLLEELLVLDATDLLRRLLRRLRLVAREVRESLLRSLRPRLL